MALSLVSAFLEDSVHACDVCVCVCYLQRATRTARAPARTSTAP